MSNNPSPALYGCVGWQVGDVKTLVPGITDEQAEAWLQSNEKYLAEAMVEAGWNAMVNLLPMDGYKVTR